MEIYFLSLNNISNIVNLSYTKKKQKGLRLNYVELFKINKAQNREYFYGRKFKSVLRNNNFYVFKTTHNFFLAKIVFSYILFLTFLIVKFILLYSLSF